LGEELLEEGSLGGIVRGGDGGVIGEPEDVVAWRRVRVARFHVAR